MFDAQNNFDSKCCHLWISGEIHHQPHPAHLDYLLFLSTHTFAVRQRPEDLKGAIIHNLNVRGKRGNIVQVYPAVEYDFVPNDLEMHEGDSVHIQ